MCKHYNACIDLQSKLQPKGNIALSAMHIDLNFLSFLGLIYDKELNLSSIILHL